LVEPLSERELEILQLIARGASNREIAASLFLAEGTVKNHVTSILGKLEVRDRTQAALKARDSGLI
jgi:DNA-binding NarL/FixJ family response regulator